MMTEGLIPVIRVASASVAIDVANAIKEGGEGEEIFRRHGECPCLPQSHPRCTDDVAQNWSSNTLWD